MALGDMLQALAMLKQAMPQPQYPESPMSMIGAINERKQAEQQMGLQRAEQERLRQKQVSEESLGRAELGLRERELGMRGQPRGGAETGLSLADEIDIKRQILKDLLASGAFIDEEGNVDIDTAVGKVQRLFDLWTSGPPAPPEAARAPIYQGMAARQGRGLPGTEHLARAETAMGLIRSGGYGGRGSGIAKGLGALMVGGTSRPGLY